MRTPAFKRLSPAGVFQSRVRKLELTETRWAWAVLMMVVVSWGLGITVSFQAGAAWITAVGFVAAIAGLRHRLLGLLGIGILCTVDPITRGYIAYASSIIRWNTLNYFLLIVIVLNVGLLFKLKGPSTRLLQGFTALLGIEILMGTDRTAGLLDVLNIIPCFGLVVFIVRAWGPGWRWYWFSLVCGVTAALGGFALYLHRGELPEVNANAVAQFPLTGILTIFIGIAIGGYLQNFSKGLARPLLNRRRQLLLGFIAAVNFCWVFLSSSRGALLAASVCIVFLLVTIKGMATRLSLAVCGVVIGLFILANYADVESTMLGRLDRTFDASLSVEERTTGRFDLARGGWYLFLDNPFGVGTGAFSEAWSKLGHRGELSGFGEGVKKESHSGWIKILAENGVPGILLLLALVCSFAIEGWRRHNRNLILLGLFASTFLGISFLSTEFQSKGIWLLVATLLAVFSLVARRRSRSAPVPQMANPRRPTIRTVANAS